MLYPTELRDLGAALFQCIEPLKTFMMACRFDLLGNL